MPSSSPQATIRILDDNGRYQGLKPMLQRGGMGYVYEAVDTRFPNGRGVAIKTLQGHPTDESVEMFRREIDALVELNDDNIVSILDVGECEQDGVRKPYLVMPLLEGQTLDSFIGRKDRLPVERCVQFVLQVCRGLQAAHEKNILHRDIKPSNIFVLKGDKVKVIDFGLARLVDSRRSAIQKGTLRYMSPEQILGGDLDHRSDLFSLGIVLYELLTNTHPFGLDVQSGLELGAIRQAIEHRKPALVQNLTPEVPDSLCCIVHKALQKDPHFRFGSAQELADDLERVQRNEPLLYGTLDKIQHWLDDAADASEAGRLDEASDILDQAEGKGHWHPRIEEMRDRIETARTAERVGRLLNQAREYLEKQKNELALGCVRRALATDPDNPIALRLQADIESRLEDAQLAGLIESARHFIENEDYQGADQLIMNVLASRPNHAAALDLARRSSQQRARFEERMKQEEAVYKKTLKAFESGNISTAFRNAEELMRLTSADTKPDPRFAKLYSQVRTTRDLLKRKYEDAERLTGLGDFRQAMNICDEVIRQFPNDPGFRALQTKVRHQEIQIRSAATARVLEQVNGEPDLDRKIEILETALGEHPDEPRLLEAKSSARDLQQVVESLADEADKLEHAEEFEAAAAQIETLGNIYPQYPGLEFRLNALRRRHQEQLKQKAKERIIDETRRLLSNGLFGDAHELIESDAEFRGDPEIEQLRGEIDRGLLGRRQADQLRETAEREIASNDLEAAVAHLEGAVLLDPRGLQTSRLLADSLCDMAEREEDWKTAERYLARVLEIDPSHPRARVLGRINEDKRRNAFVGRTMAEAARLRSAGDLAAAVQVLNDALGSYPDERRMSGLRSELLATLDERNRTEAIDHLAAEVAGLGARGRLRESRDRILALQGQYPDEPRLAELLSAVTRDIEDRERAQADARTLDDIERLHKEGTLPALREALELANRALGRDPTNALFSDRARRIEESADSAQVALADYRNRIRSAIDRREPEEVAHLIGLALDLDPTDADLLLLRESSARRSRSAAHRGMQLFERLLLWIRAFKPARTDGDADRDRAMTGRLLRRIPGVNLAPWGVGLGVVAMVGIWAVVSGPVDPSTTTATLAVASSPSGATVYIDGEEVGTTPLRAPIEVSEAVAGIPLRIALAGYDDYVGELAVEPGRTEYDITTISLAPGLQTPSERAHDEARASYARLVQTNAFDDDFFSQLDVFQNQVRTVVNDPNALDEHLEGALGLRNDLKAFITDYRDRLVEPQRGTEAELPVLAALLVLDPEDPQVIEDRNSLLAGRDRLKRDIETAIANTRFLTADRNGALELMRQLVGSFPSEQPFYQQQLRRVREGALVRLRELCGAGTNACQNYGQAALRDFPGDAEIEAALGTAPVAAGTPSDAPVPGDLTTDGGVVAAILRADERMQETFDLKQFVLPTSDSCVLHATTILELSAGAGPIAEEAVRQAVGRAEDWPEACANLAVEDARRLATPTRLLDALADRESALGVQGDLQTSMTMLGIAAPFLEVDSGIGTLTAEIESWLPLIDALVGEPSSIREVRHSHPGALFGIFGRSCEGELIIDGFTVEYLPQESNADHHMLARIADIDGDLPIDDEGNFEFDLESHWSFRVDRDQTPLSIANEVKMSINRFLDIRSRIRAEAGSQ